jgi:hypothetical protein
VAPSPSHPRPLPPPAEVLTLPRPTGPPTTTAGL